MKRVASGLLLVTALAAHAEKPSVCLLEVTDGSGQASALALLKTLETELGRSFLVVPNKKVARIARAAGLARADWLGAAGLAKLSAKLGFRYGLAAHLSRAFDTWTLHLSARDATTGEEHAEVQVVLSRPRLAADRAKELVEALAAALAKATAPPAEPDQPAREKPPPVEPETKAAVPAVPAAPDAWAEATGGFDAPTSSGAPPASAAESLRLDTTVEMGGRVDFEHYAFFQNKDPTQLGGRDDVEAALSVKAVHPRSTAFASLLARTDFVDPSRNRFDAEEAWVELNFPGVSAKVGRQLVSWGTGTLYSPSDVLNAVDLRDPLDPEKLGALMVKVAATVGPATLEAYYLPVPESHLLPTLSGIDPDGTLRSPSRWMRGTFELPGSVPLTFHVAPFSAPSPRPSNTQAAARAELSVAGMDLAVGYAYLLDHVPSPLLEAVPEAGVPLGADVYLDWSYRRLQVVTLDAERTFGKLRLAGEAAAFLTSDLAAANPRVADPYLLADLGGDFQTGQFAGEQRLHFFLELAVARALKGSLATSGIDQLRYPFPLSVLGRVAWEAGQDLRLEVNAFSSVQRLDLFVAPRLEYSFFERVKARVGVDLLFGSSNAGFFGPFRNNSRFIATVEARF